MVLNALRVLKWVSGNWGSSKDKRRLPRVDLLDRGVTSKVSKQSFLAMTKGVSTRLQREMVHQQQELEMIEAELDSGISQLRIEIEKVGSEMRAVFEQLMAKEDVSN